MEVSTDKSQAPQSTPALFQQEHGSTFRTPTELEMPTPH